MLLLVIQESGVEYIILGLLLLQSRTIYQLRKRINEGLNLMYSCSTGSIQAAIRKLLRYGYIAISDVSEKGKVKKVYSITDGGRDLFNNWLGSPINIGAAKNPELSKVYFLGLAEREARIKLIESHIRALTGMQADLEKVCNDGAMLSKENQDNDIFYYQLQTAVYGRDLMRFNIEWYNRLLADIKE